LKSGTRKKPIEEKRGKKTDDAIFQTLQSIITGLGRRAQCEHLALDIGYP